MRRRFQKPRIKNTGGYWIAQFRDLEGRKRKVSLGPVARTKKVEAEAKLAKLLEPVNIACAEPTPDFKFGAFVRQVYLPFYPLRANIDETVPAAIITEQGGKEKHRERSRDCSSF